jgi:hypothetical protein
LLLADRLGGSERRRIFKPGCRRERGTGLHRAFAVAASVNQRGGGNGWQSRSQAEGYGGDKVAAFHGVMLQPQDKGEQAEGAASDKNAR